MYIGVRVGVCKSVIHDYSFCNSVGRVFLLDVIINYASISSMVERPPYERLISDQYRDGG